MAKAAEKPAIENDTSGKFEILDVLSVDTYNDKASGEEKKSFTTVASLVPNKKAGTYMLHVKTGISLHGSFYVSPRKDRSDDSKHSGDQH